MALEVKVGLRRLLISIKVVLTLIGRTLHEPTGNDKKLFKLMLEQFDSVAYQRLVQLHCRKAKYGLGSLVELATEVWHALRELHQLADEADTLVLALRKELQKALRRIPEDSFSASQTYITDRPQLSTPSLELLTAAVYKPAENERTATLNPGFSKSFSAAEEEVNRRGHARAATFPEADYTTSANSTGLGAPKQVNTIQGMEVGSRRRGINVPRVFTGSFSQLESDIRSLKLDKVKNPEGRVAPGAGDRIEVRDFGATPRDSPCTTPSPRTPLQRREALLSKETEIQDRLIKGEVVTTRRPSTKGRAQTIDDRTGGLNAWLKQDSPGSLSSNTPGSVGQHCNLRHREKSL